MSKQLISVDEFDREIAVANTVPDLKLLADKGAAIIDYMRKAGKFDDATVNEITYRVGDAVRKAGALLEEIAPGSGRPTKKTRTSSVFYEETLADANMKDDTALNWRAAGKHRALGGVKIPEGVNEVTLRAHDRAHGYGGKEVTVELAR